jgi:signal transduction histidine kinase
MPIGAPERLASVAAYEIAATAAATTPRAAGTPSPGPAAELASEAVLRRDTIASLEHLTELAAHMCDTRAAVVNILDATHQHRIAAFGVDPAVCAVEDSMCGVVLPQAAPVMVPDATRDPRFRTNPFVTGALGHLRLYASAPLVSPGGEAVGTLCVFDEEPRTLSDRQLSLLQTLAGQVVEVLELRRRTLALAHAHGELIRSNELLSEFAGRVSHDLKSPLTSVLGFAETLGNLPAVRDDPRAARFVGHIATAGRRMRTLIDEVLGFAAVGGRARMADVELVDLIEDVLQDVRALVAEAQAEVTVEPARLSADPNQLRMLLQNLVSNSLRYRSTQRPCRVHVSATTDTSGWRLRVTDNGRGIPAEVADRVFEPLFRLDRDAGEPGTGLGLATCRRVAESHGGALTVEPTPGGGTTVVLEVRAQDR